MSARAAVFFDRDGVLNEDRGYVHRWEDFVWLPGAREAVRRCNEAGLLAIVVTNQSGIARGRYAEADFEALMVRAAEDLARAGGHLDAVYFCPHHPTEGVGDLRTVCDCRKPAPGMLLRAERDWDLDLGASWLIGDGERDLAAARAAGVRPVAYRGGSVLATLEAAGVFG